MDNSYSTALFQCCHIDIGSRYKRSVSSFSLQPLSSRFHVLVSASFLSLHRLLVLSHVFQRHRLRWKGVHYDPSHGSLKWYVWLLLTRSAKDQSRLHQVGKTVLPAIFFGYALIAGRTMKVGILVADIELLGNFGRVRINASVEAEWSMFTRGGSCSVTRDLIFRQPRRCL